MGQVDVRYVRLGGVTAERSGERTVVLDASGTMIITLSPVGTIVWESLPGSGSDLLDELRNRFPHVGSETLEVDLQAFIDELVAAELITSVDASS